MLTKRYLTSGKNLPAIMAKIVEGTAPKKFTSAHLKSIGFKSSNDQGILTLLKDLGFLSADGTPLQRYHDYRDPSRSRAVMAEALRDAYEELFHINEKPRTSDRGAIEGKFKSTHNVTDRVAKELAATFFALLKLADLEKRRDPPQEKTVGRTVEESQREDEVSDQENTGRQFPASVDLRYNVEIHLPASKDIAVYNAIFKSLKEHLIDE